MAASLDNLDDGWDASPSAKRPDSARAPVSGKTVAVDRPAQGEGSPASASADSWRVRLADDSEVEMTTGEIAEALAVGRVTRETFVIRRGLPDWIELQAVPSLGLLAARSEAKLRSAAAPSAPSAAVRPGAAKPSVPATGSEPSAEAGTAKREAGVSQAHSGSAPKSVDVETSSPPTASAGGVSPPPSRSVPRPLPSGSPSRPAGHARASLRTSPRPFSLPLPKAIPIPRAPASHSSVDPAADGVASAPRERTDENDDSVSRLGDAVDDDGEATVVSSFDEGIDAAPTTDANDDSFDDGEDTGVQTAEEVEAVIGGQVAPESHAKDTELSDAGEDDTDSATVAVYDRPMATISFELPEYDEASIERDTTTNSAPTKRTEDTAVDSLVEAPQSDPLPVATMDSRPEFSRKRYPVFLAAGVGAGLVVGLAFAISTGRLFRGSEVTPAAPVEKRYDGHAASALSEPAKVQDGPAEVQEETDEAADESPVPAASAAADGAGRKDSIEDERERPNQPTPVPSAGKAEARAASGPPKARKPSATDLFPGGNPYELSSVRPAEVSTPSKVEATQPTEAPSAVEPEPDESEAKDDLPDSLLPDDELKPYTPASDDPF